MVEGDLDPCTHAILSSQGETHTCTVEMTLIIPTQGQFHFTSQKKGPAEVTVLLRL